MRDKGQKYRSLVFYWIDNLVGSGGKFSFNVLFSLVGGVLFSFSIWDSPYVLAVFGVVSPLLFTFCLYSVAPYLGELSDNPLPKIFTSRLGTTLAMVFDMFIVIVLALLIQLDVINYLVVRILQTVIFPILMLVILRVIYIQLSDNKS